MKMHLTLVDVQGPSTAILALLTVVPFFVAAPRARAVAELLLGDWIRLDFVLVLDSLELATTAGSSCPTLLHYMLPRKRASEGGVVVEEESDTIANTTLFSKKAQIGCVVACVGCRAVNRQGTTIARDSIVVVALAK
ncbi:ubiquitin-activating enzyme E1 [Spatholobus suberectus]|nr:ubiquitin-activating enzyme E1 [Spatholobus suberectus]